MRIWIATVSEQVPSDSPAERLLRGGIWAYELERRGHKVVWWTDNVDHMRKRTRTQKDTTVYLAPGLELRMVAGPGYPGSLSLARLRHYRHTARQLAKWMMAETPPDVCLAALPALEWVEAVQEVGALRGFPVVVDCRDMWPEVFVDVVPRALRWPARLALSPMFRQKRRVLRGAFAISGITDEFLEWGLQGGGRGQSDLDFVAHHSYARTEYRQEELVTAARAWDEAGLREELDLLTICYFGVLASSTDFGPVLSGLRLLGSRAAQVRLVICGEGYNLAKVRKSAADLENVHFAGYVSGARIKTLMERSDIGLAPYVATRNYLANIPGKVSEYLSCGLPLLSGVGGATGSYLQSNRCGWQYAGGEGFAERVAELLDRPETCRAASQKAKEAFERDFPAEKIVAQAELSLERIARQWSVTNQQPASSASAHAR